jgi:hypothetical protein
MVGDVVRIARSIPRQTWIRRDSSPGPKSKLANYSEPLHCKDKMPKIWNKYSQKRNIGASVPISTFMCLWANYLFPRWGLPFLLEQICGPILGIYKSLTDTWMWKLGLRPRNINGIAVAVHIKNLSVLVSQTSHSDIHGDDNICLWLKLTNPIGRFLMFRELLFSSPAPCPCL